ncbi:MAG: SWIB/MDM2 domain-containing protein [candidate division WOR-3 bacterium]
MPRGEALMKRTVKLTDAMQPVFGPGKAIKVKDINKKLWAYIKKHNLMTGTGPLMKRSIKLTPDLQAIMGKRTSVKVGEMMKLLWAYINKNKLF